MPQTTRFQFPVTVSGSTSWNNIGPITTQFSSLAADENVYGMRWIYRHN